MRANIVQVMAHSIEECTRPEQSWAGRFLKIFLYSCLADKLFLPFRVICNNPIISLIAVLVVYLLFLILFFPLWLLSFLLTSYGSWLTFAVLFHFLAIFIARAIAFPGSSTSTIKQMSTDTIRRLADYMEQTSVACKELASSMVLIANGKVSKEQWDVNLFTMNQIWPAIEYFQQIQVYFNDAIDQVQAEKALTPDELKVLRQLCEGLSECYSHFKDLFQYMLNSRDERNRGVGSQALAVLSARCLNSSEKVRSAAHSIKPSGSGGDDDMVSSVIKSLVSFASGMSGFERLSFPYLRAILKKKHRADIVQINGSNGNKIDGLLLRVSNDPRFQKEKVKMETEQAAVGMVVFCCPNAGFYECISQFNFDKSWFGYYLQHRLDVFVYNYRGYGRSEGAPTPAALKADSLKVLEFIRKEYNPAKIVVHGESIGGMIGCYLARHGNVQGLVCDRTFSSLDGAASRLMGNWAGMSLRSLVWWQTDVVDDFLFAECDKLVLQDPNDEIIADAASLRAGVASTLVYGHTSNSVPSVTPRYAIARYTQSDVPQEKEESVWFLQADDVSKPLPQEFVDHFFACCTYILEKAAKGASSDDNTRQLNNDSSPMSLIQEQISTIELVQRKGGHAEHGTSQILVADGPVEDETVGDSATSDDASSSHSQESQKIHDEKINKLNMLVRRRYIDRIVAHSLDEETATLTDSISPYHKCWIAISRITNSCGQYFGEAVGRGLDSSRTWMASFIVWNHGDTLASVEEGDPMAEIRRAIADLEFLTQAVHANEFRGSHEVNFVIKALRVLFKRNQYCFGHPPSSSSSAAASEIDPFSHQQYGSLPSSISPSSSTSLFSKCLSNSTGIRQCSAKTVGKLIPLACGHNGWPEDDDMKEISKWLQSKNLV